MVGGDLEKSRLRYGVVLEIKQQSRLLKIIRYFRQLVAESSGCMLEKFHHESISPVDTTAKTMLGQANEALALTSPKVETTASSRFAIVKTAEVFYNYCRRIPWIE